MEITSTTIPAWTVGMFMVWTGISWFLSIKHKIRMSVKHTTIPNISCLNPNHLSEYSL